MEYFDAIKFAIEELLKWFNKNKEKKQEIFEAIEAIRQAAIETEMYLQEHRGQPLQANKDLSKIWMDTAAKVRDKDYEVYDRLLSKADYWGNPSWSREEVNATKIQLSDIRAAADKLLAELKD